MTVHTVTGPAVETLVVPIPDHDAYGCLTGDCPHQTQAECDAAMAEHSPYQPGDVVEFRPACAACGYRAGFGSSSWGKRDE